MSSTVVNADRRQNLELRRRIEQRPAELEALNAELRARNLQQAAVASLSQHAIRDRDLATLMDEAASVTAATLGTEYSAIAELLEEGQVLMRAGAGWRPGLVGRRASLGGTPAGYLLLSGEPVVITDTSTESRFPIPGPMVEHGVESAIYVIIRGRARLWGSLAAYSVRARAFSPDDIAFLQSVANVLALAVERHELEVAQRREKEILQSIFDNIPVMVSFYDSSGRLLQANRAWERTLGWTVEEAQRVDIVAKVYPDPQQRKVALEFMGRSERRWADFKTRTRDGRDLDTSWARFQLSDGSRIGFGLDLTTRKRAEEALAASEARFSTLFQASPVALGMSTIDDDRIIAVNQAWLDLFGFDADEVMGRTNADLGILVDPEQRNAAMRLEGKGMLKHLEIRVRRRSGEVREVILSAVKVHLGNLGHVISALTDITDRKMAEAERDRLVDEARAAHERLETLSRRLLTAQEEERRRLAVELHDELGQILTAVKINLESLARSFRGSTASGRTQLDGAIDSVDLAMHRVRDIALDLRPSVLDDLGLPPALRWYVDRFARDAGVEAHLAIDSVPEVEPGVATACFRVAQEALTNIARHARARQVWLDLRLLRDAIELRVRDDGVGFDGAAARQRATHGASMGLLGMEERVSFVGGTFEIRSAAGTGSEVRACFPLGGKPGRSA